MNPVVRSRALGVMLALGAACALGWGPLGCVTDHDVLAKRSGGGGGAGDAGDDASDGSAGDAAGGVGGGTDGGSDAPVEPPGSDALTLVHGVVDAKTIAFCFARATAIGTELLGDPIPKGGLGYGAALALESIAGVSFAADDVVPFVVAADSTLLSAKSCATLVSEANVVGDAGADAAPADPLIRARQLALIPAKTVGDGFSYLMVAAGCLGAPSHVDELDDSVCGIGYSPDAPTLSPVLVQMSRTSEPDALGLQVVHASVANQAVDVRSVPEEASLSQILIAHDVVPGSIEPRPPNLAYPAVLFGTPIGSSSLELENSENTSYSLGFSWATALSLGSIASVENGRTYALVLLGPSLIIGQTSWWNPQVVTLVKTDPEL